MIFSFILRRFFRKVPLPAIREGSVRCISPQGLHRMAYVEFGDPRNPRVLVCAHGLTRNGRDFDWLAEALKDDYRVICPDVVGRGRSDWLKVPAGYGFPQYLSDMTTLLARIGAEEVDWVGTSMGGLIGMMLAGQMGFPIRRLVLNDVGPLISPESLKRIGEYVGNAPAFASPEEAERYLRVICKPFGPISDEQWAHLIRHGIRPTADGQYRMHYDPAIGEPFRQAFVYQAVDLWPVYDAIPCPTMILRGAESDVLAPEVFAEMQQRGPKAKGVEFPGIGHAPILMERGQIDVVRDFLLAP
ncbi:MAG TPA: alpha/beta hydrolase [Rhodocyclaceae bacterium]